MRPRDGDYVRAKALSAPGDERVLPGSASSARVVEGFVHIHGASTTGQPRYAVNGVTIDPDSAEELAVPQQP